ncbi:TcpE family conjugal transfer membrane protein [Nonomuraea sp. CA-141351]|uniref:TcpE family conjugal transfer membrane protein n=1 Tax=Nonomuraea sp. CA-141351 TaxID=3239996 RepID=UPI003D907348
MDLPTYTNIWRIEKRLYKLYDLRLPMPLPIVWIGVFVGVFVPWSLLLVLVGVPVEMPWHVLFLVPPGIVTWLSTRPVIEGKRLTELLESQLRYLGQPKAWYRLAPMSEPETITFSARVWRTVPARAKSKAPRKARQPQRRREGQRIAGPRQVRPAVAAAAAAASQAPVAEPTTGRWGTRRGTAPALKARTRQAAPPPAPGSKAGALRREEALPGGSGRREETPLVATHEGAATEAATVERGGATGAAVRERGGATETPIRERGGVGEAALRERGGHGESVTRKRGGRGGAAPQEGGGPRDAAPAARADVAAQEPAVEARGREAGARVRGEVTGTRDGVAGARGGVAGARGQEAAGRAEAVQGLGHGSPDEAATAREAAVPLNTGESRTGESRNPAAGKPIDTEALRRLRRLAASADAPPDQAGPPEGERREDEVARDQHRKGQPPRLGPAMVLPGTKRVWPPLNPNAKPLPRPATPKHARTEAAPAALDSPDTQDPSQPGIASSTTADAPDTRGDALDARDDRAGTRGDAPATRDDALAMRDDTAGVRGGTAGMRGDALDVRDDAPDAPGTVSGALGVVGGPIGAANPQQDGKADDARGGVDTPGSGAVGDESEPLVTRPGDAPEDVARRPGDVPESGVPQGIAAVPDSATPQGIAEPAGDVDAEAAVEPVGDADVRKPAEVRGDADVRKAAEVSGDADVRKPAAGGERPDRPAPHGERVAPTLGDVPDTRPAAQGSGAGGRLGARQAPMGGRGAPRTVTGDKHVAPAPGTGADRGAAAVSGGDERVSAPDADRRAPAAGSGAERPAADSGGERRAAAGGGAERRGPAAGSGAGRPAAAGGGGERRGPVAGSGAERVEPAARSGSDRGVAARDGAGGLVAPVPVPRPGEGRVRRVESVVGRDSGGWRRIAQVVVGGGGVRTDGSEIDEARARGVFSGSRRIVVLGCTGGAGQSTTALMLGHTFATYRDDRVVAVDANTGGSTLTSKIQPETPETLTSLLSGLDRVSGYLTMRGYTTRTASGLEVISADTDAGAEQRLADRSFFSDHRLGESMRLLDRHYKLAVIDPAPALAARVLPYADQLVLVVPASEEASEAVAMTYEWLDGHGCADLRRRAVMVVNGVSRRSMADVEQAESVARGRCRAIVRVPWEDGLAPDGAEVVDPGQLRAAGRRAYLALAGVVVAGFAAQAQTVRPSEEELASDPPGTRIGER